MLVPLHWALGLGLPSLPRHLSGVGTQLSSALLAWALVKGLDQPPNGTLLFSEDRGRWEWRLSAGTSIRSSGESLHMFFSSLWTGACRKASVAPVCVEGLSSFRADVVGILMDSWELFWTG